MILFPKSMLIPVCKQFNRILVMFPVRRIAEVIMSESGFELSLLAKFLSRTECGNFYLLEHITPPTGA